MLGARVTPPSLPHSPLSPPSYFFADHDQRQCFDHEDSQWATAPSASLTIPLLVASSNLTYVSEHFVEIVTDGWHYNRPPPIS